MARENYDNDTFLAKVVMVAMLNTAQVLEGRVKSLKQLTHVEVTSNKQSHDVVLLLRVNVCMLENKLLGVWEGCV